MAIGVLSGSDLIERHTAFPIYASLLPPESRALWKAAQLEGKLSAWARYFPTALHGEAFTEGSRLCPACVTADREAFGFAYWRVEHQLPSVLRCHVHGGILHDRCAECGTLLPLGKAGQLPGTACKKCGAMETAPLLKVKDSAGARAHAALIARAAAGDAAELAPQVRIPLIREAWSARDSATVITRFCRFWGASGPSGLQRLIGCKFSPLGLQKVIGSGAGQVPFALLVAVVAFAMEELGADRTAEVVEAVRKRDAELCRFDAKARSSDDLGTALHAQARWLGVPLESVEALMRNEAGIASLQVGTLNLVSMIDRLPAQHRAALPL